MRGVRRLDPPPVAGGLMGFAAVAAFAVIVRATIAVLPELTPYRILETDVSPIDGRCLGVHEEPGAASLFIGRDVLRLRDGPAWRRLDVLLQGDGGVEDPAWDVVAAWADEGRVHPRRCATMIFPHDRVPMEVLVHAHDVAARLGAPVVYGAQAH